jgi:sugar phosphate isomerase/epimerase
MQLSLSVRVAESAKRKDVADVPIETLAPLARGAGFRALSMRASVVSVTSPPTRVQTVRQVLADQGLRVSMVTGDIPLAANNAQATDAIRNIAPYLDLAEALDCRLVRIMAQHESDIALVQRAADTAAERGLTLAHMTHWGTLIETVDDALQMVRAVNRANFGVVYEAVRRLAPHLVNVMFQNVHKDPASPIGFRSNRLGQVGLRYVPLDDRTELDAAAMVEALRSEGYAGWVTVHQPLRDRQSVPDAIAEAAAVFGPLVG